MFTGIYLVFTQVLLCLTGFYLVLLGFDFAPVHLGCASDGTGPVGIVPSCSFLFSFFFFLFFLLYEASGYCVFFFFFFFFFFLLFVRPRFRFFPQRCLFRAIPRRRPFFFFFLLFHFFVPFPISPSPRNSPTLQRRRRRTNSDATATRVAFFFFAHRLHDARFLFVRHRPSPDQWCHSASSDSLFSYLIFPKLHFQIGRTESSMKRRSETQPVILFVEQTRLNALKGW